MAEYSPILPFSLFLGDSMWADKVEELKNAISILEGAEKRLLESIKPTLDEIERLKKEIKPVERKLSDIRQRIFELREKLKRAEAEAFVESLKAGMNVWIVYDRLNRRYDTVSEEWAKNRLEERKAGFYLGLPVPRLIRIVKVKLNAKGERTFEAEGKRKERFVGIVERTATDKIPRVVWYKQK